MNSCHDTIECCSDGMIITYHGYRQSDDRQYPDLMDWLGDSDIVTASEIEEGCWFMGGSVYYVGDNESEELYRVGMVKVPLIGELWDMIDYSNQSHIEFIRWYYHCEWFGPKFF